MEHRAIFSVGCVAWDTLDSRFLPKRIRSTLVRVWSANSHFGSTYYRLAPLLMLFSYSGSFRLDLYTCWHFLDGTHHRSSSENLSLENSCSLFPVCTGCTCKSNVGIIFTYFFLPCSSGLHACAVLKSAALHLIPSLALLSSTLRNDFDAAFPTNVLYEKEPHLPRDDGVRSTVVVDWPRRTSRRMYNCCSFDLVPPNTDNIQKHTHTQSHSPKHNQHVFLFVLQ